jgi:hypothetical protein
MYRTHGSITGEKSLSVSLYTDLTAPYHVQLNPMLGHNKSVAFFWKPTPHQTNNTVSLQS